MSMDHRALLRGRMRDIITSVPREEGDAIMEHLLGGTSAAWLARTLTEHGHPIGASTVKDQRARFKEGNE